MLPWRTDALTECGRRASDVTNVITLDDLDDRIRCHGHERSASTVCMTCWETSRTAARWETNPVHVIAREAVRAGLGDREPCAEPQAARFGNELRAIAALVDAHRDEFNDCLAALELTASITEHRRRTPRRC